jgi:leucyl aminopeptidase
MPILAKKTALSTPIVPVTQDSLTAWLKSQTKEIQAWVKAAGFTAGAGAFLAIPDQSGKIGLVLFGSGTDDGLYNYADLPARLPHHPAGYYIDAKMTAERATQAALGWVLGTYQFHRYQSGRKKTFSPLVLPANADRHEIEVISEAVFLVRDLVNTPANDLGPEELAAAAKKLLGKFKKATLKMIVGDDLVKQNYPAIYAVGKGSPRAPRLIDIRWGDAKHPLVTLVGKGVCFDTGGLNLKTGSSITIMKKDMGGAAHVLGLAQMIMSYNLPVRLRVLIPAVENATDGNSYRPLDIIQTRKGLSIEIGDTDAEGRLVLADALAEACAEKPALVLDYATLTGAARVALGPDLPAMFSNHDKTAEALLASSRHTQDPLWRLPLWQPYADNLNSKIADANNVGGSFAGAITAALFLEKFVDKSVPWVHIDTYAWNPNTRAGRPEGGEALGMRAGFDLIKKLFSK